MINSQSLVDRKIAEISSRHYRHMDGYGSTEPVSIADRDLGDVITAYINLRADLEIASQKIGRAEAMIAEYRAKLDDVRGEDPS